jgi:hypothetical protein
LLTTIDTDGECISDPLVPMIVKVDVAGGVFADVVTVIVELPAPGTVEGANDTVTPVGCPLTLRSTPALKPFSAPTFTVYVVLLPGAVYSVTGLALIEKSGVVGNSP